MESNDDQVGNRTREYYCKFNKISKKKNQKFKILINRQKYFPERIIINKVSWLFKPNKSTSQQQKIGNAVSNTVLVNDIR